MIQAASHIIVNQKRLTINNIYQVDIDTRIDIDIDIDIFINVT